MVSETATVSTIALHKMAKGWLKGRGHAGRSSRWVGRMIRPAFVELEDRRLLSFAAPVDYVVGTQASTMANGFGPQVIAADFHNNGKLDLAVTNTADGTVSILAGNGNGTFQPAVTYNTDLGAGNPIWLAAADFTGDGNLDLAIEGNNGEVSVMLGNGNGTFAAPQIYEVGSGDRGGLAVGDFFGSGRQDIATAIASENTVAILPNNGNGTFGSPVSIAMPAEFTAVRSVATANFFGEGYADLAVAVGTGYNNTLDPTDPAAVALFKNDGKGDFTYEGKYLAAVTPDPGGGDGTGDTVNPEHVNAYDLTGDGRPDIVMSLYDHNIDVFINEGNGTFGPAQAYDTETAGSVGGYPRGVVFGDFNGDGKIDIATLNFGEPFPVDQPTPEPGSVRILYGNGDGTFQPAIEYTPYLLPGGLAVGDFSGNGLLDLAVTQNYTGHSVAVMLNQPASAQEPPTVTIVSPNSGPTTGGTRVTITGTNFAGTSQVYFGSIPAAEFTVSSNTSITATAPAEASGAVDISVYNAGASATSNADLFTFSSSSSRPVVAGVSPSVGSTIGGTVVAISGTNFTGASGVMFGSIAATTITVNSATSITAVAPAEAAGTVDVTVTTPGGTSADAAADHYIYQVPVITSIDVWTGLGATSDWSDAANWSLGALPGPTDTVQFDGTSSKNAIVDPTFGGSVAAVLIDSSYSGLITLTRSQTVAGTFTQFGGTYYAGGLATTVGGLTTIYAGTFDASTSLQTLSSGLDVSGGTFAASTGIVSTGNIKISSGTIDAPSTNLVITSGSFVYSGGTFNADHGTITLAGIPRSSTVAVGAGSVHFYNFTDSLAPGNGASGLTITGTLTVTGTFSWFSNSNPIYGYIDAQGDVDDQNHGVIGNPYLTLDGSANQTIEDLSGQGGGHFETITINKTGGTVSLACNPIEFGGLIQNAGTINTGTHFWVAVGPLWGAPERTSATFGSTALK